MNPLQIEEELKELPEEERTTVHRMTNYVQEKVASIKKIKDLKPATKTKLIVALLIATIVPSREVIYGSVLHGFSMIKFVIVNGIKIPVSIFDKSWLIFSKIQSLNPLFAAVEGACAIPLSALSGLIYIFEAILKTCKLLCKYCRDYAKSDRKYFWDQCKKDIWKVWEDNLVAAMVTSLMSSAIVSILVAAGVTVAWPFIVASVAGAIIGGLARWLWNSRKNTKGSKIKRDQTWKAFAITDNESSKNEVHWPEQLDDLIFIFESMACLSYVCKQTLDEEKINIAYNRNIDKKQSFMEKFETESGKWDLRKAICLRYVTEIQNSKTEVEKCVLESANKRYEEIQGKCTIL